MVALRELKQAAGVRSHCPRCGSPLARAWPDQEPLCQLCGYADYHAPAPPNGHIKGIVASGTTHIVRYSGKFPLMRDTTVTIRVLPRKHGRFETGSASTPLLVPACPFEGCGLSMEKVLFVGKHKTLAEDRYACEQGHRISLLRAPDGTVTWR